ncbi:DUF4190 domain-containing protein [Aeromicrobium sp.]|uniref:DUF4190 domain-containing protein n=1 Tax=Aeromicrobium sp. TaxID=1871063 RepID=UPI001993CFA5|nr:DUF4190 domain-containing protein [Aeromicrobium sp.]MBC7632828.1 DUF4190 domain-containing protein [Aeromicrobium sp.]
MTSPDPPPQQYPPSEYFPPYPPAQYQRPAPLPAHPRATTALVLGILGVVGAFVLVVPAMLSPLAWYYGAMARREADREPQRWSRSGEATVGMILGMIGTAILAAALFLLILIVAGVVIIAHQGGDYVP